MIRPALAVVTSLLLLLAAEAAAQVVSPIEQSYGPYLRPIEGYEPAMAVSRTGILLAWSEVIEGRPQIRIGLLDFHGRLVSPVTTIATGSGATSPVVTTDGTTFRVAYVEGPYSYAVDVDEHGAPLGPPRRASLSSADALVARWSTAVCFPHCGIPPSVLDWTFLGQSGRYFHVPREPVGTAGAGGTVDHFMLAWATPRGVNYLDILHGAQPFFPGLIAASALMWDIPGVDCDATHCLVAFTTPWRQIYAVLVDSQQPDLQTLVPIETSTRVGRPQVHLLQPGRFLVSYSSAEDEPQNRFAGRIVTTQPLPRRRAVR